MMRVPVIQKMLLLLAGAMLVFCAASAQAETIVGVVMTGDIAYYQAIHKAFVSAMGGGGVQIVVQTPAPEPMAWANSARKLVTLGSKVIVSYGAPATLSTMKATSSVPIIFAGVYDPEAMEIAGKNATGISSKVSIEAVLSNLKKAKDFKSLGVVFNKTEKDTILQVREVKALEGPLGFRMVLMDAKDKDYSEKMQKAEALLITTSCGAMCSVDDILKASRQAGIPVAATIGGAEDKGILFTTYADPVEQGTVVAEIVKKVLGGQDPSSITLREPTKIEFVVNSREAEALGLDVPKNVLNSATRVIR